MSNTKMMHEIVVGSTTTRLKLATDESGRAMYNVSEDVAEHSQVLEIGQGDWTGGHGQYQFNGNNAYFRGQSIDTTQEGRLLLGPLINQVYQTPTKKQAFESGDDTGSSVYSTNWYAQGFTPSDTHTIGSVSLYGYRDGSPGTMTVSIRATTGGIPSGSDLTVGTIDGNTLSTSAAWVSISFGAGTSLTSGVKYAIVVRTASSNGANAFVWRLDASSPSYAGGSQLYSSSSGVNWSAEDTIADFLFSEWTTASTALASTPTCFIWSTVASKFLCADTSKIYYYANNAWTAATTVVAGVTQFCEYNGKIYAARGSGNNFAYSTDGLVWTDCTLTDHHAIKFLSTPNTDGTANNFYKLMTSNELAYSTNPVNGGTEFSSPTYVGDTTSNVTNVFLCGDQMAVGREDNLYYIDSVGGIHASMNDLQNQRSTDNFKYFANFQGATYFSLAGGGMGEITGSISSGVYRKMGPLADTGDIDKVGVVKGIAADTDYLYVAMLEETVIHIYKGKPTSNGLVWDPWVYLGQNACEWIAIAQHSATDRRLWFGYGTHTTYVQITDNPTADPNARFCAEGWMDLPWIYGNNPYFDKMLTGFITETSDCSGAGRGFLVSYRKDNETTFTELVEIEPTNGIQRDLVPSTTFNLALAWKRIQIRIGVVTADSTITPQLRAFILQGTEKPTTHRVHTATYNLSESPSRDVKTDRAALRTARTNTTLIKFADLRYGDTTSGTVNTDYVNVVMLPGYPREVEIIQTKGRRPDLGIECKWMEV